MATAFESFVLMKEEPSKTVCRPKQTSKLVFNDYKQRKKYTRTNDKKTYFFNNIVIRNK